ncbi:MAG: 50S ribosomal protein L18 [Actinomycetota bacterium]
MALKKVEARTRRHARVRKQVVGSAQRPRLAVFRSNRHIYAQVIDDLRGHTIASASALDPEIAKDGNKSTVSKAVGLLVGKRALASGVEAVVFDRGGFRFQGRVRELAEGAREAGLKF